MYRKSAATILTFFLIKRDCDPFKREANKQDQASLQDAIVFELCQSVKGFCLVDTPSEFVCKLNWFNRANRESGARERIKDKKNSMFDNDCLHKMVSFVRYLAYRCYSMLI